MVSTSALFHTTRLRNAQVYPYTQALTRAAPPPCNNRSTATTDSRPACAGAARDDNGKADGRALNAAARMYHATTDSCERRTNRSIGQCKKKLSLRIPLSMEIESIALRPNMKGEQKHDMGSKQADVRQTEPQCTAGLIEKQTGCCHEARAPMSPYAHSMW